MPSRINKIWNTAVSTPKTVIKKTKELGRKALKAQKDHHKFMQHEFSETRALGGREVMYNPFSKKDKARKAEFLKSRK